MLYALHILLETVSINNLKISPILFSTCYAAGCVFKAVHQLKDVPNLYW